ncbi:MAG: hypothetical protein ACR2M1_01365 [Gemmatimonadaceae bacterium]
MKLPTWLARLPLLDRFTLPRYDGSTLSLLANDGIITPERLANQSARIPFETKRDAVIETFHSIVPRFNTEEMQSDGRAREAVQVAAAERNLGPLLIADVIEQDNTQRVLPFIRYGSTRTASAGVRAINGRYESANETAQDDLTVREAAEAMLLRNRVDVVDLAREVRSRPLFDAIAHVTEEARASASVEDGGSGLILAHHGATVLTEITKHTGLEQHVEKHVEPAAVMAETTDPLSAIKQSWTAGARGIHEVNATLQALARLAPESLRSLQEKPGEKHLSDTLGALDFSQTVLNRASIHKLVGIDEDALETLGNVSEAVQLAAWAPTFKGAEWGAALDKERMALALGVANYQFREVEWYKGAVTGHTGLDQRLEPVVSRDAQLDRNQPVSNTNASLRVTDSNERGTELSEARVGDFGAIQTQRFPAHLNGEVEDLDADSSIEEAMTAEA